MGDVAVLNNTDFFRFMAAEVNAQTYAELFGGYGSRTIAPLWGFHGIKVTAAEIEPDRRKKLAQAYSGIELFEDYKELELAENANGLRQWDLVSADAYIGNRLELARLVYRHVLKRLARRAVITYAPQDLRGYVERCSPGEDVDERVDALEEIAEAAFGTRKPTPEIVADAIGVRIIAKRVAPNMDQIAYFGGVFDD